MKIFKHGGHRLFEQDPETATRVEVVSRAELRPGEREAIAAAVEARSPKTAEALRAYRRRPDLFALPR